MRRVYFMLEHPKPYLSHKGKDLYIEIYLQTRASKNAIIGEHGGKLKISVTSPPIENQANEQLIAFLAKELNVPKKSIVIVRGQHSRNKQIMINY